MHNAVIEYRSSYRQQYSFVTDPRACEADRIRNSYIDVECGESGGRKCLDGMPMELRRLSVVYESL